jgi:DNA-binding response OmpR family regulator
VKIAQKKKILFVDDDPLVLDSLKNVLEAEGYYVDFAINGREAIEKSNSHFYNLAIVDWRLPDIYGTTLLTQIKETIPRMPKIMLTGYPSKELSDLAIKNGADAFIIKPANVKVLLSKIDELLRKQEVDALTMRPLSSIDKIKKKSIWKK